MFGLGQMYRKKNFSPVHEKVQILTWSSIIAKNLARTQPGLCKRLYNIDFYSYTVVLIINNNNLSLKFMVKSADLNKKIMIENVNYDCVGKN